MELYRDGATLYKCTPTKTADLPSPPHYTQADNGSLYSLLISVHTYWAYWSTSFALTGIKFLMISDIWELFVVKCMAYNFLFWCGSSWAFFAKRIFERLVNKMNQLHLLIVISVSLFFFPLISFALSLSVLLLCVVCSEVRNNGGLCFSWAPCFSFTWPRSSTPPSTHSRPTERFSAASAF